MSGPAVSQGQGNQNRKLLEQLEERKKRLQGQQPPASASSSVMSTSGSPTVGTTNSTAVLNSVNESQHMNSAQKAALQHAHANSVGYFITQDSAFGNLILPVLPRFDK